MSCENFTFDEYKRIRKQKKLFGTFGFRGVVNEGMGAEKAKHKGAALAYFLGKGKTIAIGKDPRISSPMLEEALIEEIIEHGCNALTLGIITPNTLLLEVGRQADACVMITASHNSPEYNGMKCLNKIGMDFSPEEDLAQIIVLDQNIKKEKEENYGSNINELKKNIYEVNMKNDIEKKWLKVRKCARRMS